MRDRSPSGLRAVILLLLLTVALVLVVLVARRWSFRSDLASEPIDETHRQLAREVAELEAKENALDQKVWAKERLAEQCGQLFESLWDLVPPSGPKAKKPCNSSKP